MKFRNHYLGILQLEIDNILAKKIQLLKVKNKQESIGLTVTRKADMIFHLLHKRIQRRFIGQNNHMHANIFGRVARTLSAQIRILENHACS